MKLWKRQARLLITGSFIWVPVQSNTKYTEFGHDEEQGGFGDSILCLLLENSCKIPNFYYYFSIGIPPHYGIIMNQYAMNNSLHENY